MRVLDIIVDESLASERLGYDSAWFFDHFYFAFFFHDRASPESLELFATRVIPMVKRETA